jgi:glycosyltransferase involved in cell wall biosynthesis
MPLTGRRLLVLAEYDRHGGTREYFKRLMDFYFRQGAEVLAVTTFDPDDPAMRLFVGNRGIQLKSFSTFSSEIDSSWPERSPATWDYLTYRAEQRLFRKFLAQDAIKQVVISVGTSGRFLSAASVLPNPVLIAHGYPHGLRQQLFGRLIHGRQLPDGLTIVPVSRFSAEQFDRFWATHKRRVRVEPILSTCGPDLPLRQVDGRSSLVLTAALMEDTKNPTEWLAIARQSRSTVAGDDCPHFSWLGDGPLLDVARHAAAAEGLDNVSFPGWSDDVHSAYNSARVYLQTSKVESLGLSVVDAIRHGVPCVVSNSGGLPEIVDHGVNGFVYEPGDIVSATRFILRLLKDDELHAEQSEACRAIYRERFSESRWERALISAHMDALQQ